MMPSQIFAKTISDLTLATRSEASSQGKNGKALFARASSLFLVLIALVCAQRAHAISFDKLTTAQSSIATSGQLVSTTVTSTSSLGGSRFIQATSNGNINTSGVVGGGNYSHSQDAITTGTTFVRWDGNSDPALQPAGLNGLDLTKDAATGIKITVVASDSAFGQPITVSFILYDSTDATGLLRRSRGSFTVNSGIIVATDFIIPFANFVGEGFMGGVDFTKIGAIEMFINGNASTSHDLALSFIGTNGNCPHVPVNGLVVDQCGVCNGDNSSCSDCLGVPNGPALPGVMCPTGQPGVCADGTWQGVPPKNCLCKRDTDPKTEICDQLDNDCDGVIDEGFDKGAQCSVGIGACKNDGVKQCAPDGTTTCSVKPKAPSNEICDNIDNNCNGTVDEGFDKGVACTAGVGACLRNGTKQCLPNGTIGCSAVAGAPSAEICDGIDNDCDSFIDEGFDKGTLCIVGVGACQNTGVNICSTTGTTTCSVTPKAPSTEKCDNIDNDCDGSVDEGFDKGSSCTVGVGVCQKTGVKQCGQDGTLTCSVSAGTPSEEVCDGLDNDCDGQTDEGFEIGTSCSEGVGACQATGLKVCSVAGTVACSAVAAAATEEICDGIDNDCDGAIDEENPKTGPMVDQCGVCKGDGMSCVDCKGVMNGTAKKDECGVCGGDGTSCLQCSTFDQSETLGTLDNGAKEQQIIIRASVGALRSIPQARREAKFISQTLELAQKLTLENWDTAWRFPIIATDCQVATSVCVSTSNVANLTLYRDNNLKLRNLATAVLNKVKRYRKGRVLARDKKLRQAAEKQFQANLSLSRTVPELQFACVTGTGSASATR